MTCGIDVGHDGDEQYGFVGDPVHPSGLSVPLGVRSRGVDEIEVAENDDVLAAITLGDSGVAKGEGQRAESSPDVR